MGFSPSLEAVPLLRRGPRGSRACLNFDVYSNFLEAKTPKRKGADCGWDTGKLLELMDLLWGVYVWGWLFQCFFCKI